MMKNPGEELGGEDMHWMDRERDLSGKVDLSL